MEWILNTTVNKGKVQGPVEFFYNTNNHIEENNRTYRITHLIQHHTTLAEADQYQLALVQIQILSPPPCVVRLADGRRVCFAIDARRRCRIAVVHVHGRRGRAAVVRRRWHLAADAARVRLVGEHDRAVCVHGHRVLYLQYVDVHVLRIVLMLLLVMRMVVIVAGGGRCRSSGGRRRCGRRTVAVAVMLLR